MIEIKASITGERVLVYDFEALDYEDCFLDAVTEGQELTLKCTESVYNLFNTEIQKTDDENKLCKSNSNIKLEKIAN